MLRIRLPRFKIGISIWFAAFAAIVILVSGSSILWMGLLAMLLHELGHLAAMFFVGCPARAVYLLMGRMVIHPSRMPVSAGQEIAILSGGILANLLCALVLGACGNPQACLVNLFIAAYNALPAGQLDGGAILLGILNRRMLPKKAYTIHLITSFIVSLLLLALGFLILIEGFKNISMVLSGVYLLAQNIKNLQYTN